MKAGRNALDACCAFLGIQLLQRFQRRQLKISWLRRYLVELESLGKMGTRSHTCMWELDQKENRITR